MYWTLRSSEYTEATEKLCKQKSYSKVFHNYFTKKVIKQKITKKYGSTKVKSLTKSKTGMALQFDTKVTGPWFLILTLTLEIYHQAISSSSVSLSIDQRLLLFFFFFSCPVSLH